MGRRNKINKYKDVTHYSVGLILASNIFSVERGFIKVEKPNRKSAAISSAGFIFSATSEEVAHVPAGRSRPPLWVWPNLTWWLKSPGYPKPNPNPGNEGFFLLLVFPL